MILCRNKQQKEIIDVLKMFDSFSFASFVEYQERNVMMFIR